MHWPPIVVSPFQTIVRTERENSLERNQLSYVLIFSFTQVWFEIQNLKIVDWHLGLGIVLLVKLLSFMQKKTGRPWRHPTFLILRDTEVTQTNFICQSVIRNRIPSTSIPLLAFMPKRSASGKSKLQKVVFWK